MQRIRHTHWYSGLKVALLVLLLPTIVACTAAAPEQESVVETVVITATPDETGGEAVETTPAADDTADIDETGEPTDAPNGEATYYTTPHPILSDIRVRQAIAHCTNRPQLIESVYPFLSAEEQENLLMDTFLPRGHWAHAADEDITTYPFDPEAGQQLLEDAGWTLDGEAEVRTNADGNPLVLKFLSTDAQIRQTWAAVFEQQLLENCGVQLIRTHAPGSYVFGTASGLARRDFELGAYAWVGSVDPKGTTLYACDQIPLPTNNWAGQNYMGWCNEEASRAIIAANSTLDRAERAEQYGIVQREFTADMVSLPLFNRFQVAASTPNLLNYRPDPTEYHTANIAEWELADGGDTVVIGMTQEPETLFTLLNTTATAAIIGNLLAMTEATGYSYDYQAAALAELPTIENSGAILQDIEIEEGDLVFDVTGEILELAPGVEVTTSDDETIVYEEGTITMPQLSVTFEYVDGITWEDGVPLSQEDFELSARISCDPEVGRTSYRLCESRERIEFHDDTSYTIHYVPGALWPEYSVYTIAFYYPAHRELSEASLNLLAESGIELEPGSTLGDVPASEWSGLTEVNEQPLSTGPYRLVEWQQGQRMIFEANPYYYGEPPAIPNVIINFIGDSNQAVAQLLNGSIDVLGNHDLEVGAEVETVLDAAEEGTLEAYTLASPTWEHVDMNLFTR